jgi:hypothetical protein
MSFGKLPYLILLLSVLSLFLFSSCNLVESEPETGNYEYDFTQSDHQWEAFFTNYPEGWGEQMELASDYRSLPEPLNTNKQALYIRGFNNSDDLKMLFRRKITGLEPHTTYSVGYTIRFATSAPTGCVGVGGDPGEAVKVVADISHQKPEAILNDRAYWVLSTEQREDDYEWFPNSTIGHIANNVSECDDYRFEMKTISTDLGTHTFTTDSEGSAWLLFGTRSGFEGATELYYSYFKAEFAK